MGKKGWSLWTVALILVLLALVVVALNQQGYINFPIPNGGSQGGSATLGVAGKVGIGVTVEFADGSIKEVTPSTLTLIPLTVYFQGQPISKITWNTAVLIDWSGGDLTSLTLSGPMEVKANTGIVLRKENTYRAYSGSNMAPKNQLFTYWSFSLEASEIEYDLGGGSFTLTCTISLNATAMFSSGTSDSKSATTSTNVPIEITSAGLSVLQVSITPQIFK